ncbi:MAG: hypothetical protein EP341_11425 [Sphingomonadales bacterium]|nr:MAG: hypothetical protein EP341_11425 [Sphingomonadales bacterium]
MNNYTEIDGAARYAHVAEAGQLLFGGSWKARLARHYGLSPAAVTKWGQDGAPVWVCVAIDDAVTTMRAREYFAARSNLEDSLKS